MSELVRWLGLKAEELGVEIYPGFAVSEVLRFFLNASLLSVYDFILIDDFKCQILYDKDDKVIGVATNDMGVGKSGTRKGNFQPGVELKGKFTGTLLFSLFCTENFVEYVKMLPFRRLHILILSENFSLSIVSPHSLCQAFNTFRMYLC